MYQLIGGAKNGELTSKTIANFLNRNDLDEEVRKRLLIWKDEFEFWESQTPDYPLVERAKYHRDLVKAMRDFIDPKPGEKWGDFGCGPAIMSQVIWEKSEGSVKEIVALDIILASAKKRAKKIPALKLKYGNLGERLPFDDETFDGIASNIAIPHVVEFESLRGRQGMPAIFKELFRILKPGGELVWSTPKENFHPEICFISAAPDVLRERKNVPKLFSKLPKYLRYGRALREKAKKGIYTYLPMKEWDEILLQEVGFVHPKWRFVFWAQCYVNKVYRPLFSP